MRHMVDRAVWELKYSSMGHIGGSYQEPNDLGR